MAPHLCHRGGHARQWEGGGLGSPGGKTVHPARGRSMAPRYPLTDLGSWKCSLRLPVRGLARPDRRLGQPVVQRGTYDARAATRVFRGRPRPCQPFVGISRRSSVGYMGPSNSAAGSYAVGG